MVYKTLQTQMPTEAKKEHRQVKQGWHGTGLTEEHTAMRDRGQA